VYLGTRILTPPESLNLVTLTRHNYSRGFSSLFQYILNNYMIYISQSIYGVTMTKLYEYRWIAIAGAIFGCIYAFGIGANDVANSFGSSVSAKSLTIAQAIIAASICELSGSMLLGASVTGTIKSKIIKSSYYQDVPQVLMFGMLCSLLVGAVWLLVATAYQYPVSTTHIIVACLCGFSLSAYGIHSINWKQVYQVFISWVASPVLTGCISFIMFTIVKHFVLKSENTFTRAILVYPIVVFIGITVNLWFVLYKSNGRIGSGEDFVRHIVTPVAFGSGLVCGLATYFILGPVLKKRIERFHQTQQQCEEREAAIEEGSSGQAIIVQDEVNIGAEYSGPGTPVTTCSDDHQSEEKLILKLWNFFADNTFRQDLQSQSLSESKRAAIVWENSVIFEPKTEHLFSYVQGMFNLRTCDIISRSSNSWTKSLFLVFTACLTSFAHGANDVANAIAPLSAIFTIYDTGSVPSQSTVSYWVLAMGGVFIDIGFIFFGYRIIKAVGFKITKITPSRGFCIELATSLTVAMASFIGIPISTTQCLVGATAGVGLADMGYRNVEWYFLLRTCVGWLAIFFIAFFANAAFFGFCIYSPSLSP